MKPRFDIRQYKTDLRKRFKAVRNSMVPDIKRDKDIAILSHVLNMSQYMECETLLTYISMPFEVDTRRLITAAAAQGKRVAVPRCVRGSRDMDFYNIESMEDLVPGEFGVLEPDPAKNAMLTDFASSLCILPGLAFDRTGYRLGYGGGYYDRFLSYKYDGVTAGICYQSCTVDRLRRGRFDIACDFLVTEDGCVDIKKRKK